jgi:LAS superfamily LD-carboxypeptidase LdcB
MAITEVTGQSDNHIHWFSPNTGVHHAVVAPWQKLCDAAEEQGFNLSIASGFRSFERQLAIWNKKCSGQVNIKDIDNNYVEIMNLTDKEVIKAILTFSALPGASRHHWGTDIDFYDKSLLLNEQTLQLEPWEYQKNGPFSELTNWLKLNANAFGFYFPYDEYRGGIAAEPWHLSYFPISEQYEKQLTITALTSCLQSSKIANKSLILEQLETIYSQYIFNIGHFNHG